MRTSRKGRWLALAAFAVILLSWWASDGDEPQALAEPALIAVREPEPTEAAAAAAPAIIVRPEPAPVAPVDAGIVVVVRPTIFDAGLSERELIELTMRRWRDALAPLFRRSRGLIRPPPVTIAVSGEARGTADRAPAPPAPCEDGVLKMALRGAGTIDIVVAIDTSGSMYRELPDVVRWLAELELALRAKGVEFQLLVVADQRRLSRIPERRVLDGGQIQATIGSTDAFETLISTAREGAEPRWTQLLRAGSTKHLVMVTDDEANDPQGLPYLVPLIAAGGGALGSGSHPAFVLHLLGGFEPSLTHKPVVSQEPLVTNICQGGVEAGLGYQRVAIATGGLRASLCYRESYRALTTALIEWPVLDATPQCVWVLPPQSSVVRTRALKGSSPLNLWEARDADACTGKTDGYWSMGQAFTLCGRTCAALAEAGYDLIEISTRCVR